MDSIQFKGAIPIGLAITQLIVSGLSISLTSLVLSASPHPGPHPAGRIKIDEEAPPLPARNPPSSSSVTSAATGWNINDLCYVSHNGSRPSGADAPAVRSGRYQMTVATIRSVGLLFSRIVAVGVFMVIIYLIIFELINLISFIIYYLIFICNINIYNL